MNYDLDRQYDFPIPLPNSNDTGKAQIRFSRPTFKPDSNNSYLCRCDIIRQEDPNNNPVMPEDFENVSAGVIFVETHGIVGLTEKHGYLSILEACPKYTDPDTKRVDLNLADWCRNHEGQWSDAIVDLGIFEDESIPAWMRGKKPQYQYPVIGLKPEFFANNWNCEGSLVMINACYSRDFYDLNSQPFQNAQVYIGTKDKLIYTETGEFAYKFFCFMLGIGPDGIPDYASSAFHKAKNAVSWKKNIPELYDGPDDKYANTYLPGSQPSVIVIQKK